MLTSLPHVYYVFLQVGVVVILLAALAVMVTARTGSGVALAVLLALVAAAYVAGIISNARVVADPDTYFASRSHPFGGVWTAITEAADLGLFCVAGVRQYSPSDHGGVHTVLSDELHERR